MKRIIVLFSFFSVFLLVVTAKGKTGFIHFTSTYYSFGTIPKNQVRKVAFPFHNTGSKPVIIQNVDVSCGCISAKYTKRPIKPGKKGYIIVYFNPTQTSVGHFKKTIDVWSNASNSMVRLFIEGSTH